MTTSSVDLRPVRCPKCRVQIDPGALRAEGSETSCPTCRCKFMLQLFPRLGQPLDAGVRNERAMDGEAVCFFHADRRAALACDQCGRFICGLCEIVLGARRVCPSCLAAGLTSQKVPEIVNSRVAWSRLSCMLGIVPIFILPVWFLAGPFTIWAGIRGFTKQGSLVYGRQTWLGAIGILLGAAQCFAFAAGLYSFVLRAP